MGVEELSPRNARVVALGRLARQRKVRESQDRFVVDGPVLLADAVRDGLVVEDVFIAPEALADAAVRASVAAAEAVGARAWSVTGGLDRHLDVSTPHGVAAVARRPQVAASPGGRVPLHLVLVGVADPGNVGTLLRTAEAVGATSVVVADGSADVWAPKVVRSSAGSTWRVPVTRADGAEALARLGVEGVARVGAAGGVGERPEALDLTGPVALVLGNEAHGLPDVLVDSIDRWASLPMEGSVESLNVAIAGSVLAFEVVRQRAGVEVGT